MKETYIESRGLENNRENLGEVVFSVFLFLLSRSNYLIGLTIFGLWVLWTTISHQKLIMSRTLLPLTLIWVIGISSNLISGTGLNANLVRDLGYFVRPIVIIYAGTMLAWETHKLNSGRTLRISLRVVIEYSLLGALTNFVLIIMNLPRILANFSFNELRSAMGSSDEIIMVGFALLLFSGRFLQQPLFRKKSTSIFSLIFLINLIISMSRTKIVIFLIAALTFTLFEKSHYFNLKSALRAPFVLLGIAIFLWIMYRIGILNTFINKIINSSVEINSNTDWNIYQNIVHDWRGYENYVGGNQFSEFSFANKLFGMGFGTLIPVQHSDLVGIPLTNNGIIVLHNGYLTILIKTGVLGLILYLLYFIRLLYISIKSIDSKRVESIIIISCSLVVLINTLTTTGLFKSIFSLGILLVLGYFSGRIFYGNSKKNRTIN